MMQVYSKTISQYVISELVTDQEWLNKSVLRESSQYTYHRHHKKNCTHIYFSEISQ